MKFPSVFPMTNRFNCQFHHSYTQHQDHPVNFFAS
jgi:hypothetical protein